MVQLPDELPVSMHRSVCTVPFNVSNFLISSLEVFTNTSPKENIITAIAVVINFDGIECRANIIKMDIS